MEEETFRDSDQTITCSSNHQSTFTIIKVPLSVSKISLQSTFIMIGMIVFDALIIFLVVATKVFDKMKICEITNNDLLTN